MSLACEGEQEAQHETTIPSFSVTSGMDYTLPGYINGVPGNLLVDTGAAATLLAKTVWDKAKTSGAQLETPAKLKLIGVQGEPLLHQSPPKSQSSYSIPEMSRSPFRRGWPWQTWNR